jgi:hypothetical protein
MIFAVRAVQHKKVRDASYLIRIGVDDVLRLRSKPSSSPLCYATPTVHELLAVLGRSTFHITEYGMQSLNINHYIYRYIYIDTRKIK